MKSLELGCRSFEPMEFGHLISRCSSQRTYSFKWEWSDQIDDPSCERQRFNVQVGACAGTRCRNRESGEEGKRISPSHRALKRPRHTCISTASVALMSVLVLLVELWGHLLRAARTAKVNIVSAKFGHILKREDRR